MKGPIVVKDKTIGGRETFVIAEIGSNHNQSLSLAYESIDAAAECGADAVKFQSIRIDQLYYQPSKSTRVLHKKIDLDEKWHWLLDDYCRKKDIIFFSTPTYLGAVDILEEINVPLYKLASAQVGTFPQILEKVAKTGKPIILSTGIVTRAELKDVMMRIQKYGNHNTIVLHCNSIYPTPYDKVFLPVMADLRKEYEGIVGFSDHTLDIFVPIGAVAMGAKVIEKHFALDRNLPVPDAAFSLEPADFKKMVEGIRAIEKSMVGDKRDTLQEGESLFKEAIRTRLVSNKVLRKGEEVRSHDFRFLRYSEGVDCRDLWQYLRSGARYSKDIEANKIIYDADLKVDFSR